MEQECQGKFSNKTIERAKMRPPEQMQEDSKAQS